MDFHVGSVTRPHDDLDVAVWLADAPAVGALLVGEGWEHAPEAEEDGYTAYTRGDVRAELAYLARGDDGGIYTPLRDGRGEWPPGSFAADRAELQAVRASVVSLASLVQDKSEVRDDPRVAAKDRADLASLATRRRESPDPP